MAAAGPPTKWGPTALVSLLGEVYGLSCLSRCIPVEGCLLSACVSCVVVQLDKTSLLKKSVLGLSSAVCEEHSHCSQPLQLFFLPEKNIVLPNTLAKHVSQKEQIEHHANGKTRVTMHSTCLPNKTVCAGLFITRAKDLRMGNKNGHWPSCCTACIQRMQWPGYSPKNTCHLTRCTAKQQSPHENNETAFNLVLHCPYEQTTQPCKVRLLRVFRCPWLRSWRRR